MKSVLVACAAALALSVASTASLAAPKKKVVAGSACVTGKSCSANCENGWCSRYACVNGKWEKRLPACAQPACREAC
jgi:hypothetical protein